ncbi:PepSY domain-containing protein [Parvibaculum sp.]|uniref:PepSY domain-containing protein n=1 Tax=Parvibaculum sp. TaxID=2024848 RepID=UPI00320DB999
MMKQRTKWRGLLRAIAVAAPFCAVLPQAFAGEPAHQQIEEHDHDRARRARERGEIKSLEEIMPTVSREAPGEISHIELERDDGLWVYEFRIIDAKGHLEEIKVDAATGRIIEREDD